jgi:hypothetical protein
MDSEADNTSTSSTTQIDKAMIAALILECGTVDYYDYTTHESAGKFKLKDNMTPCDLLCSRHAKNQRIIHTKDEKNKCWRHACSSCGRTKSPCDGFMLPKNSNVNRIFDDYYKTKY